MNNNKIIILIFIMLTVFMIGLSFNNMAYGTGAENIDVLDDPKEFQPKAINGESGLSQKIGVILGAVNKAAIVSSVATLMALGIKYMMGSVEEKAEYKKDMGMYLLGIFLAISITTIPNIIYKISSSIE